MINLNDVIENENLKKHTTFGIGGTCRYLIKPQNIEELIVLLNYLKENKVKYYVLGNGSNVILDDNYFDGVIIKLNHFNQIKIEDNIVTAGAGVMLPKLVNIALQNNLVSFSFASMIPGTVGGSVVGNAGAYGSEMMDILKSVKVLTCDGKIITLNKDNISFGYRYTTLKDKYIVLEATFISEIGDGLKAINEIYENNEKRKLTQPLEKKNVGSIFRNPDNNYAGKLIEDAGLKGMQKGGAKISEKHANFIVNENNATFNDVVDLIELIKEKIKNEYSISLVVEPAIIRWHEL